MNSTGVYKPPYGKGVFKIAGRGASGNYSYGGNVSYYNPATGGNVAYYNPDEPGNYAGTNPGSGGNYTGTNPPSPGNVAGYNPPIPGNSGTNPSKPGIGLYEYHSSPNGSYSSYTVNPYFTVSPFSSYNPTNQSYYSVDVSPETIEGNGYQNSSTPGYAYYNPGNPGNANYNPYVPGNAYYNPDEPGYAEYNPYVPGNAVYNPYVPGTPGSPTNIFGVTFPGGPGDSLAPVIGPTPSSIAYSTNGVTITVPAGGYVTITGT